MKAMVLQSIFKKPLKSYFEKWKNSQKKFSKLEVAILKIMVKNLRSNHNLVV